MIPEWMLLMDMSDADREAYLANKAAQQRLIHIRKPQDRKKKRV